VSELVQRDSAPNRFDRLRAASCADAAQSCCFCVWRARCALSSHSPDNGCLLVFFRLLLLGSSNCSNLKQFHDSNFSLSVRVPKNSENG
jgi:hypothetical protein